MQNRLLARCLRAGFWLHALISCLFISSLFISASVNAQTDNAQTGQIENAVCDYKPLSYAAKNLSKPNKNAKKQQFFERIIPAVHRANQAIIAQRKGVIDALYNHQSHAKISLNEQARLVHLATDYRLKTPWPTDYQAQSAWLKALLIRVDIIPASLVVAQAANESAWGKSRFAQEGNNYFGQWCYKKGCGLVPKKRAADAKHEVAVFKDMQASITSYLRNLNSHYAYQSLRNQRAQLRCKQQALSGLVLAHALLSYSEKGQAYIDTLTSMINYNKLYQLDALK